MYTSLFPIIIGLLLFSCSSNNFDESKMDIQLRQKINSVEEKSPDTTINFLGKCSSTINHEMKSEIENLGIEIQTIIGEIFTASGNAVQIKELTRLEYIVSLELSVERKPF